MPLVAVASFDHGLTDATSLKAGNAGARAFDNAVGAPGMAADSGRGGVGTRALDISTAASAERVEWGSGTFGASQNRIVTNFWIKFPSALPTTDAQIAKLGYGTPILDFKFRNSDDKLIVTDGTTSQAGPVIVADTWYHVEIYSKTSANPWVIKWWIDGVAQTDYSPAIAAQTLQWTFLGSDTNQSVTCNYDDWLLWTDTADITGAPFGKHSVKLLKADTGGVTAQIGTADATGRMVTNSAIDATHNSANILAALSEVPPLLGATATGVGQRVAGVGNAVGIPMTTYTLQSGETITGLRVSVVGWASAATANEVQLRTYNGTTETTLQGAVDPNFDNSTASPAWLCKMATLADFDTQAELDALVVRFGYSTDIAPLPGAHAIYAEVAVKEATGPPTVDLSPITVNLTPGTVVPTPSVALSPITVTLAPGTVSARPSVALSPVTTSLTPGAVVPTSTMTIALSPITLPLTPGTVSATPSVGLSPVTVTLAPGTVSPQPSVGLSPVTLSLGLGTVSARPSVALSPVMLTASLGAAVPTPAVGLSPITLTLTPGTVSARPTVGLSPVTITLGLAALDPSGVAAGAVALSPITTTLTPGTVSAQPTVALSPITITVSPGTVSAQPTVGLSPITITLSLGTVSARPTVGLSPITMLLSLGTLSAKATAGLSPVTMTLSLAALIPTGVTPGAVALTPITTALGLGAVVPTPTVNLSPVTAILTMGAVTPRPTVGLAAVSVGLGLGTVNPAAQPVNIQLDPIALALGLGALDLGGTPVGELTGRLAESRLGGSIGAGRLSGHIPTPNLQGGL